MARTSRDIVDYFPHDSRASDGDTLTVLQSRFGNNGYAFWFKLLEKLSATEGHCLDCSTSVKWQLLLAKTGVNEITGVEIVNLLVEMQALDKDLWQSKLIWCQKLVDNIAEVYKNRKRQTPQKPLIIVEKPITTADNAITNPVIPQSKVEYSRVDKRKEYKKYGQFENVLLSDDEYEKLKTQFDSSLQEKIEELSVGIASKGYKYKSHYATILSWARKHEKETGGQNGTNQRYSKQGGTKLPDRDTGYTPAPPDPALDALVAAQRDGNAT